MALNTLSGTLEGPGNCKKCLPGMYFLTIFKNSFVLILSLNERIEILFNKVYNYY